MWVSNSLYAALTKSNCRKWGEFVQFLLTTGYHPLVCPGLWSFAARGRKKSIIVIVPWEGGRQNHNMVWPFITWGSLRHQSMDLSEPWEGKKWNNWMTRTTRYWTSRFKSIWIGNWIGFSCFCQSWKSHRNLCSVLQFIIRFKFEAWKIDVK